MEYLASLSNVSLQMTQQEYLINNGVVRWDYNKNVSNGRMTSIERSHDVTLDVGSTLKKAETQIVTSILTSNNQRYPYHVETTLTFTIFRFFVSQTVPEYGILNLTEESNDTKRCDSLYVYIKRISSSTHIPKPVSTFNYFERV